MLTMRKSDWENLVRQASEIDGKRGALDVENFKLKETIRTLKKKIEDMEVRLVAAGLDDNDIESPLMGWEADAAEARKAWRTLDRLFGKPRKKLIIR